MPNMSLRHNVPGVPRIRALHRFLDAPHPIKRLVAPFLSREQRLALRERVRATNLRRPPQLDLQMRRYLLDIYRDDILALQDLLERDLSRWLDAEREDPRAGGD